MQTFKITEKGVRFIGMYNQIDGMIKAPSAIRTTTNLGGEKE
jgi:hypothetical protein